MVEEDREREAAGVVEGVEEVGTSVAANTREEEEAASLAGSTQPPTHGFLNIRRGKES